MEDDVNQWIKVDRPIYDQEQINEKFCYEKPTSKSKQCTHSTVVYWKAMQRCVNFLKKKYIAQN